MVCEEDHLESERPDKSVQQAGSLPITARAWLARVSLRWMDHMGQQTIETLETEEPMFVRTAKGVTPRRRGRFVFATDTGRVGRFIRGPERSLLIEGSEPTKEM